MGKSIAAVKRRLLERQSPLVLVGLSLGLTLVIGAIDFVARLGGDELAIVLPEINYQQAQIALGRAHSQLQLLSQDHRWSIGFSMGAITFTVPPESLDSLIAQADQLMYAVKNSGKNRLECREYSL